MTSGLLFISDCQQGTMTGPLLTNCFQRRAVKHLIKLSELAGKSQGCVIIAAGIEGEEDGVTRPIFFKIIQLMFYRSLMYRD